MKSNARELFKAAPAARTRKQRLAQRTMWPVQRSGAQAAWVACAALGIAGCTVTADEFSPVMLESGEPRTDVAPAAGALPAIADDPETTDNEPAPASVTDYAAPRVTESDPALGATLTEIAVSTPSDEVSEPTALDAAPEDNAGDEEPLPPPPQPTSLSLPVGWANVPGLGVDTTTGGGLAPAVLARTADELVDLAARPEPLTIAFEGTFDVGEVALTSNKTLIGIGSDATLLGGIAIIGTADAFVENVIIANLNVVADTSLVDGDGIAVQYAHHVWIEHCALSDAPDGLLDIVHGADFLTVSNTRFFYTAAAPNPQHRFAVLVGNDITNGDEDRGHLNVTWHHNFWAEGVDQALVSRFGGVHVFNNLFRSPGNDSVLSAGLESNWLVESNHFEAVAEPHAVLLASFAALTAIGNVYDTTSGSRDTTDGGFVPPYPYGLDSPIGLAQRIEAVVGPR